ncbi:YesL family protein [Kribbella sp. CA-247076]|uniref:YesL family protein n=1 Tax=Kribbella sp. CA-247076 TaxID=3239941 RepID=UPI003D8D83BB
MEGAGRTNAVLSKLSVVGDLLMLQLVFLVLSVGIVTLFPAAFAMQRVVPDAISQDRPSLLRRYFQQFKWAFRRFWLTGLGLYFGGVALAFGLTFWASSAGVARILALAVLIPLTGMIVGLYLSALAVLPTAGDETTTKSLFRSANLFLLRRSLPVAGGVIGLITWFALLSRLPTLFVVGSGLVPALIAYWLSKPSRKTSENVSI